MKSGFSALELVMSMSIATMLMTALLMIYNQITHNMTRVDRFVTADTQIIALKNRFAQDIAGLSGIWYTQADLEKKSKDEKTKPTGKEEKKKQAPYFYSVNKEGRFDVLTFVTNNPLQSYGASQDRFVRIVYQLEPDAHDKKLFRLLRKEIKNPTENIDEQIFKQGKFYELATGIKSLDITYYLVDKKELQKQAKQQRQEKGGQPPTQETSTPKQIIRSVKQWNLSDIAADAEKKEKSQDDEDFGGAAVPKFIEMKLVFASGEKKAEKTYKISFVVPCTVDNIPKNIMVGKGGKVPQNSGQSNDQSDGGDGTPPGTEI